MEKMDSLSTQKQTQGLASILLYPDSDDFHLDVLMPAQFFPPALDSPAQWNGARRLLFAVLQDAVACWFRYRHASSTRQRQLFRETYKWFWAKEQDRLYAFECICAHLNLDPEHIRRGLLRWQSTELNEPSPVIRADPVFFPTRLSCQ
jgi:hypothetical protein